MAMATSEEFQYEAFNRFREDDAGSLCRKDKVIFLISQRAWAKSAKKERCVIMSEMRSRANLIMQMHIVVSRTFQGRIQISAVSPIHVHSPVLYKIRIYFPSNSLKLIKIHLI